MNKRYFVLVWLMVLAVTVGACVAVPQATPAPAAVEGEQEAAVEEAPVEEEAMVEEAQAGPSGEIVFLNNGTLEFDPATAYNLERFREAHPEIQVTVVEENDVLARLSTLVTGGGEAFDVAEPPDVDVPQFIQIGALLPLDDLFPPEELARYPEGSLGAVTGPDGHIYGKPHFVLPQVLVYNTDLLAEAGFDGPPQTWDEIIEYGQALTNQDQWGYVYGAAPNRDTYYIFASYLYQAGGELFNDDFTAAFNSEAGQQALQFMADLRNEYQIVPPGVNTYDGDDVMNPFIRGQAAMVQNWGFTIDRALNHEESMVKDSFGVSTLPVGPSGETTGYLVMFPLVIPSSAQNPEAAKVFIDFMTNQESQKYMLLEEPGNVVAAPDVFELPEVMEGLPFAEVIADTVMNSKSEYHPRSGEVVTILVEEIHAALVEEKTVEDALQSAADRVDALEVD